MIALPTGRGLLLSVMTLVAVAVALVNVGLATALAATLFVAFYLASFLMAQCSLYFLRIERASNGDGFYGAPMSLPVVVTNRSFLYRQATVIRENCSFAPGGVLRSVVPPLAPHESLLLERELIPERRGCFELSRLKLSGGDPAGLFRRSREFKLSGEVSVHPKTVRLDAIELHPRGARSSGADGRPLGQSGQGQEFFGLRPWRPGDEIRFIHWKGTAAKRQLMIREFEANTVDQVVILLDTRKELVGNDPRESNLEFLVSLAASLTEHLKELSCRVLFLAADGRSGELVRLFGEAANVRHHLMHLLTLLEPGSLPFPELMQETADGIPPGSLVYALCLDEDPRSAELLELLYDANCRIHWILAPKENFPPIQADEPRIVYERRRRELPPGSVRPREVFFSTQIEEVLNP